MKISYLKKNLKYFGKNSEKSKDFKVKAPEIKRKSKKPSRFIDSSDEEEEEIDTPIDKKIKDNFRKIYFQVLDMNLECLKSCFEQKKFRNV